MKILEFTQQMRRFCLVILAISITCPMAFGQYFGRNKAQYENFKFKVLETPHFEVYHYFKNNELPTALGQASERWYDWHSKILNYRFKEQNPLIFYKNHADFQQTTVISGLLGTGTGGVTESLRNRVIMPLTSSNEQTDHVLGHELVHAFQYNMILQSDSTNMNSLNNIPLWMVEGMAEYMSTGRVDAHTAMWMRDAVLNKDIPSLDDLTSRQNEYFPYRYGQAVWAFIAGVYGDDIIAPLFRSTAMYGLEEAMIRVLGASPKTISGAWKTALIDTYSPYYKDTMAVVGKAVITEKNGGRMNVSPAISPNGKYIAFISERNVITTDLYIADAQTGKIVERISNNFTRSHIDEISFLESVGAWSPDSRKFASIIFSKGRTNLLVVDVERGRTLEEIKIPGVEFINNATWSPDGQLMLISGLVDGRSDLYLYNMRTRKVEALTNDGNSDIQPAWSPDGRYIVFATDRGTPISSTNLGGYSAYRIATIDLATRQLMVHNFFPGADNLNPQFGPDSKAIYFLSNADGFRNIYEYKIDQNQLYKLTSYFTGVSGITAFSPALSISHQTGEVAYNVFRNKEYNIYRASLNDFVRQPTEPHVVNLLPSTLPPRDKLVLDRVGKNLTENTPSEYADTSRFSTRPYDPKFQLSYIGGSAGGGVSTGGLGQGPMVAGGVSTMFTDILSHHQVMGTLSLNGQIQDISGQVAYLNQKQRLNWGVSASHIPFQSGGVFYQDTTLTLSTGERQQALNAAFVIQRTFQDQISLFSQYAISQTRRLEASTSFSRYSYRVDQINNYYTPDGQFQLGQDREKLDAPDGFNIGQANMALVGDNSVSGVASPLNGHRYRFDVGQTFGAVKFNTVLADYRKYFYAKPVSFAFRGMHYGRYGGDANALFPLFIGNEMFVRGYNNGAFQQGLTGDGDGLSINQVVGSRMAVANAEVRLPFTGPERLAIIKSGLIFSDLVLFGDAGLAWSGGDEVKFGNRSNTMDNGINAQDIHVPVYSTGASLRINLFGYFIIEPYYAIPLGSHGLKPNFGFFLSGGGF